MSNVKLLLYLCNCLLVIAASTQKEPDYKIKERVEGAEIIFTGKLLHIACFDENFILLNPDGPCTGPESKNKLRYTLRGDDFLKGRARFIKEQDLRQKVFFYSRVDEKVETVIKDGQEKIFFFQNRDLDPVNIDGVNFIPISERKEVEQKIKASQTKAGL